MGVNGAELSMWPKLGRIAYIPHERLYTQEKKVYGLSHLCLIYYVDMTEYDYSPDAYERHLATQEKIARWVDQTLEHSPCNPFTLLPPEEYERTQTPQPAFRATPQGEISPTYSTFPRHGRHEQSQWRNPSRRSSTSSASLMMPQERATRPQFDRSVTSPQPQTSPGQFFPQASNPGAYPVYSPYSNPPSRIPSPYSPRHSTQHREQPAPMPHRSSSLRHGSVHSPHTIHASPVIQQQHYPPYFSPSHHHHQQLQQQQHVVVLRGDSRDFTVLPPPGHHVQYHVVCFFITIIFSSW